MRASQKILFPYLNTPGGLAQWFADDVKIDEDKFFHFFWNGEEQRARVAANRRDQFVRFEYLPDAAGPGSADTEPGDGNGKAEEAAENLPYVEFSLEKNDLTQSVFLRVTDYTNSDEDEEEIYEIWESMIAGLKELIGG